ncbi:MAG: thioesterase family protein [Nitrospirota bacterium]
MSFDFPHRVTYAETDKMGFVYYGNYLTYFEIGRTELIRSLGRPYSELEDEGYYLPVIEASCRYLKSALYDDLLTIRTVVSESKGVRLGFKYEILRDNENLAEGMTLHAFVDRQGKPVRPPAWLLELLKK